MTDPGNETIAERLEAMAALLELAGAGSYSVRAYRRAAGLVRSTPAPVADLVRAGRARELRGIGPSIEARLRELVETGEIAELRELEREVLPEVVGFGRLLGLSAQRSVDLARALGVETAADLRAAIESGDLQRVKGVGPVTEARLRRALAAPEPRPTRALLLDRSRALVAAIAAALGGVPAGDPRRFRDLSERLAVVVAGERPAETLDRFAGLPQIVALLEREASRAVGVTVDGVPVELARGAAARVRDSARPRHRVARSTCGRSSRCPRRPTRRASSAPSAFPGCRPSCASCRSTSRRGACSSSPTSAATSTATPPGRTGRQTVREMAEAAAARGYAYLAICDHTPAVGAVPGLDADAIRRQADEIAAANEAVAPFRVLRGVECDILPDGSLDLADDVLAELDWVQASVHRGQRGSREELTRRTLAAARHPAVSCISHPLGRILGHRPANALDLDELFAVCAETGTAVETNGLPDRIDLPADAIRAAIAAGVRIVASTDSHSTRGLANMELAVGTARRGGATAADVLNTRPLEELLELRK